MRSEQDLGPAAHRSRITLKLEPSFFVIAGLLGSGLQKLSYLAIWIVVAFASVLIHELGHAWALLAFGSSAEIRIRGMGGSTTGARLSRGQSIAVSAAGPAAGILLVGLPALWMLSSSPQSL